MNNLPVIFQEICKIYFCFGFDESTRFLKVDRSPILLSFYQHELEPWLKSLFALQDLDLYRGATHSQFGDEIATIPQISLINRNHHIDIPNELLDKLSVFLKLPKCIQKLFEIRLYWGLLGRSYFSDSKMLITDGLQFENEVFLDTTTHHAITSLATAIRIIHELLHTLGVTEQDMPKYILPAYYFVKTEADLLADQVRYSCVDTHNEIVNASNILEQEYPYIITNLKNITDSLEKDGLLAPREKLSQTTIYHPIYCIL